MMLEPMAVNSKKPFSQMPDQYLINVLSGKAKPADHRSETFVYVAKAWARRLLIERGVIES